MIDNEKFGYLGDPESVWKLFEKTGNVSYYLLYKKLTGEDPR